MALNRMALNRLASLTILLVFSLSGSVMAMKNVVVVLDDSGSMRERMAGRVVKMDAAKDALVSVLASIPEDAQLGVLVLNGHGGDGEWVIPLGPIDKDSARKKIKRIRSRRGTPLGQFMKVGADELMALRERQHYGTYNLLIVTDGEANDSKYVERYIPDIMSRGITVDVIGVDMKSDHSLATRVHTYRRADDPQALTQAISEVFAESTGSANDNAESDFDFLQGFPDEVASPLLTAISEVSDNTPVGERTVSAVRAGTDEYAAHDQSPLSTMNPSTGNSSADSGSNSKKPLPMWILVIGMFLAMSVVKRVVKSMKSSR